VVAHLQRKLHITVVIMRNTIYVFSEGLFLDGLAEEDVTLRAK